MPRHYIPREITYYLQEPIKVKKGTLEYTVRPAFPVGSESIELGHKVVQNAEEWARSRKGSEDSPVTKVTRVNVPEYGYRLVDVDVRREGGRAWKVVSPQGFLVDLREDVFLPILLEKGIPASGLIEADLQWCQNGSQLRLEALGTKQHEQYEPAEPPIPIPPLTSPDGKYEFHLGTVSLYDAHSMWGRVRLDRDGSTVVFHSTIFHSERFARAPRVGERVKLVYTPPPFVSTLHGVWALTEKELSEPS